MNLDDIQRTGIAAIYKSADILRYYLGHPPEIKKKGAIDLVTQADIESEKKIIETITSVFPDHGILAEESGKSNEDHECVWIIDPLDGTTNFAHNLGIFSTSIAFSYKGEIVFGVVNNPVSQELFSAVKGKGAFLNNYPIHVSETDSVSESLLVTGFAYNFKDHFESIMARFTKCIKASQGVRRLGSAALDLCFVACGRFESFWEQNLKPWDTAAGFLIAQEAGAMVTDFNNQLFSVEKKEILATNGKIHKEMLSLLKL